MRNTHWRRCKDARIINYTFKIDLYITSAINIISMIFESKNISRPIENFQSVYFHCHVFWIDRIAYTLEYNSYKKLTTSWQPISIARQKEQNTVNRFSSQYKTKDINLKNGKINYFVTSLHVHIFTSEASREKTRKQQRKLYWLV